MNGNQQRFHIMAEEGATPVMYGIRSSDGICARRISTDYGEVSGLVARYNRAGLSSLHLREVVEDFQRG